MGVKKRGRTSSTTKRSLLTSLGKIIPIQIPQIVSLLGTKGMHPLLITYLRGSSRKGQLAKNIKLGKLAE
jgi:hypothetical protein